MIDIFRIINGTETVACCVADDNASIKTAIMGVNEVVIDITVDTVLDIAIGDHIRVDSIVYELNRDPEFNQKSEVEHQYSFTFEHPLYRLLDKLYIYKLNKKSSFTLTGRLSDFAELLIWNINQTDDNPNGVDIGWTVGTTVVTEYKTLVFGNILCRDVLTKLANDFGVEFYLNNKEINFVTHIENETGLVFAQGKGKGLYTVSQKNVDTDNAVTRVYAIGGTQNIPADHADADGHLVLPEIYIENFSEYGKIVERGVEFNEIYPTFVGAVTSASGENNCVIQCADIDFDIKTVAVGEEARINFLTGDLMGKAFSFQWNNEKKEITLIEQEDETASPDESGKKPTIPSVLKKAKSLDEFNFTGLQLPDAYVANAVERLRKAATDWLEFYCRKRIKFELSIDHRYLRGKRAVVPGDLVTIKVPEHNIDKVIRVTSVDKKIKTGELTCVVSNYLDEKWEKKIEGQISSMQNAVGGSGGGLRVDVIEKNDSRPAKDTNVFSSLRALDEISSNNKELLKKILRKDQPDRTDFPLTMGAGAEFGNFTPGFLGSGGSIDENGDGEVRDLKVRGSLEVNEFRFNRIDVISGESWNTFAFGKFTSVDTEAQIVTVDLIDGEMLTSHVNDINRGIFHNLTGGNSTDDGKDECGFKKVFGYTTSYFTPIELLPDGKSFRYSLKPGTTAHPCAEMKYAAYGNFTDKTRQSSSYETRTTEILLANVNTWEIDADRHYMFIKGLLDGITIGGVELHGYSTLQRNGYIMGTQIQFTPEQLEDMKGNDAYSVSLSSSEGTVVVDSVGNIVGAMQAEHDVVSGEEDVVSGEQQVVASRWRLSTRIQVIRGKTELVYGEAMREDGFTVVVHAIGCEYKLIGGVISITKITDIANARLELEINCEGMGVFSKTYHITALLDGNSVWATYHDSEDMPARPLGGGTENGWHRNLTMASLWTSQKNSRLVTDGEWGEPVPLHGDNAYTLNLTSDSDAILCDVDGKPLKKGTLASTVAQLYIGSLHQEQGVVYSMEAIGCGIEESKNTTGNVVVTGISEDAASVMVTALYKAKVVRKQYSLTRANGTAVYQLLPSSDVIKRSIKGSSYALYPEMLRCGVTRFDGATSIAVNGLPDGYALKFSVPGGELQPYVLNSDLNTSNYPEGVRFSLFNETQVLIDHEVIPVVSDGEPHFKLDLSNENASVTCDKDGNVIGTIPPSVATVYAGSAIDKGWTFTAEFSGCTGTINTSGLITVTGLNADNATVAVTAIKGRYSDLVAAYTLSKVLAGADGSPAVVYWVLPSVTAIHKNKYGGCTPSSVVCLVMRQVGNVAPEVVSGEDLRYQLSTGQETAYTGAVAIGSAAWIDFALYGNGVVLDKERIPVVVDGSDGGSGDDGAPGDDAKAVWLTSDVTQLVEAGVEIIPSSFTVYCKDKIGASGAVYNCYDFVLSVWRSADNVNWSKVEEKLFGGSITVYPTSGYKYYTVRASLKPMSSFSSDFALSLSVNSIKNGTDGHPGANATSYWLASSVTQIVRNSIGNVEPSSFTVYCKKSEADEVTDYAGLYLSVWRSNDGKNWSQVGSAIKASSVNVTPSASYNQYVIRAGSVAIPSWGSSYALSVSVNMVKDGADGIPGGMGPMGSMPRLCGEFTSGQSYVWNSEFRDIVYKIVGGVNQLFMVGTFGRTVTTAPSSSTQNDADWVASSKWQFVATDTLLAEGANIAGFMYRAMKMISQAMIGGVPNLSLDGINGNIAIAGDGLLVIGDKGRTAYFEFNAKANQIKLYNTGGENLMSFGISSGVSWMELKSGSYTLTMYGSSITLSYGSSRVMLSPQTCSITDGSSEATIQSSSVRVKSGDKYTSIDSDSVNCVNAAGELAMLSPTELYFTKTGNSYS